MLHPGRRLRCLPWLAFAACVHVHAEAPAPASVQQVDDAIVFRGRIDAPAVTQFLVLLQDPRITRLVITSHGGLVWPALDMAEAVHARGLDVEVPEACLSSCANYVFPAGRRKLLARPDVVGWHGNMTHVMHLHQSGQGTWEERAIAGARVLARREQQFFARIGVDGFVCWFGKLPPHAAPGFYAVAVADMERFGIRDVQVLDAAAAPDPAVPVIAPDWGGLELLRPRVGLEE